jgi:hypothetical protein
LESYFRRVSFPVALSYSGVIRVVATSPERLQEHTNSAQHEMSVAAIGLRRIQRWLKNNFELSRSA